MASDTDYAQRVAQASCLTDLLDVLVLDSQVQSNRVVALNRIHRLGLDIEHWGKTKKKSAKRLPLETYLVFDGPKIDSSRLKYRLIRAGLLKYECARCALVEWFDKPLTLHLDHINGNRKDNRLENLRLLCPSCHSLTPTYGKVSQWAPPRSAAEMIKVGGKWRAPTKSCPGTGCKEEIQAGSAYCKKCSYVIRYPNGTRIPGEEQPHRSALWTMPTKIAWPATAALQAMVAASSYRVVASRLGVSSGSVCQRINKHPDSSGSGDIANRLTLSVFLAFRDSAVDHTRQNVDLAGVDDIRIADKTISAVEFGDHVISADSLTDLLIRLGLRYAQITNRKETLKQIERLGLSTSHWDIRKPGTSWVQSLEEYLVLDGPKINTTQLKYKLVGAGLLKYKCKFCGIVEWQGEMLALHLDHVDGNRRNNHLANLRLLCPNCHSQTDTYGVAPGVGTRRTANDKIEAFYVVRKKPCGTLDCSTLIDIKSNHCRSCENQIRAARNPKRPQITVPYQRPTKISWPPAHELKIMLQQESCRAVARRLGVSDKAVMQRLRWHPGDAAIS